MSWFMSVAAGAALGYFLFHFIMRSRTAPEGEYSNGRRLYRSKTDRKIAGVCGGIAEYLDADPTVVRLAAILLVFGWGSGLLAYIICALVIPEE